MTAIASGSSALLTVTSNQQIAINSAPGVRCDIEATSGVPGAASKVKLATHKGGFAIYGPFGAGTVTLFAIGGAIDYTASSPLVGPDVAEPVYGAPSPYPVRVAVGAVGENGLAVIGDSFGARWRNASGLTVDYQGKGFLTWMLAKLGQGLTIVSDSSAGGAYVSLVGSPVAPLVTQVDTAIASGAKRLLMIGNINDVLGGVSSATIKAAWTEIIGKALAAGMRIYWVLQPGLGASSTAYTVARQAQIFELNRWAKHQVTTRLGRLGVTIIDGPSVLQDPTSETGDWVSGALNSTEADPKLHPSQPGAMLLGFEAARVIQLTERFPSILPTSNADNKAYSAASNILNSNGLFVSGTNTATGYTTAVTGGAAVTPTLASRSDGFGNDQVLTGTFAAEDDSFSLVTADLKANLTVGKKYRMVCELNTASSTNLRCIRVQLAATATASAISNWGQLDTDSDPDAPFTQELSGVVAMTEPFEITAALGTISNFSGVIRAFGAGAGGTTLKIGRLAIEEMPATA